MTIAACVVACLSGVSCQPVEIAPDDIADLRERRPGEEQAVPVLFSLSQNIILECKTKAVGEELLMVPDSLFTVETEDLGDSLDVLGGVLAERQWKKTKVADVTQDNLSTFYVTTTRGSGNEAVAFNTAFSKGAGDVYGNSSFYWPATNPGYHFYASNVQMQTGADTYMRVQCDGTKDVVYAALENPTFATKNTLSFNHAYARLKNINVVPPTGFTATVSAVSLSVPTTGTVDVTSGEWVSTGTASAYAGLVGSNDAWVVPGTYHMAVTYSITDGNVTKTNITRDGDVTLVKGKKNNININVPDLFTHTIVVSPATATIDEEQTASFTATYKTFYGDTEIGSQDVTSAATWTSLDTDIATTTDTKGVFYGAGPGTVNVRATYGGVSGEATLTVNLVKRLLRLEFGLWPAYNEERFHSDTTFDFTGQTSGSTNFWAHVYAVYNDGTKTDVTTQIHYIYPGEQTNANQSTDELGNYYFGSQHSTTSATNLGRHYARNIGTYQLKATGYTDEFATASTITTAVANITVVPVINTSYAPEISPSGIALWSGGVLAGTRNISTPYTATFSVEIRYVGLTGAIKIPNTDCKWHLARTYPASDITDIDDYVVLTQDGTVTTKVCVANSQSGEIPSYGGPYIWVEYPSDNQDATWRTKCAGRKKIIQIYRKPVSLSAYPSIIYLPSFMDLPVSGSSSLQSRSELKNAWTSLTVTYEDGSTKELTDLKPVSNYYEGTVTGLKAENTYCWWQYSGQYHGYITHYYIYPADDNYDYWRQYVYRYKGQYVNTVMASTSDSDGVYTSYSPSNFPECEVTASVNKPFAHLTYFEKGVNGSNSVSCDVMGMISTDRVLHHLEITPSEIYMVYPSFGASSVSYDINNKPSYHYNITLLAYFEGESDPVDITTDPSVIWSSDCRSKFRSFGNYYYVNGGKEYAAVRITNPETTSEYQYYSGTYSSYSELPKTIVTATYTFNGVTRSVSMTGIGAPPETPSAMSIAPGNQTIGSTGTAVVTVTGTFPTYGNVDVSNVCQYSWWNAIGAGNHHYWSAYMNAGNADYQYFTDHGYGAFSADASEYYTDYFWRLKARYLGVETSNEATIKVVGGGDVTVSGINIQVSADGSHWDSSASVNIGDPIYVRARHRMSNGTYRDDISNPTITVSPSGLVTGSSTSWTATAAGTATFSYVESPYSAVTATVTITDGTSGSNFKIEADEPYQILYGETNKIRAYRKSGNTWVSLNPSECSEWTITSPSTSFGSLNQYSSYEEYSAPSTGSTEEYVTIRASYGGEYSQCSFFVAPITLTVGGPLEWEFYEEGQDNEKSVTAIVTCNTSWTPTLTAGAGDFTLRRFGTTNIYYVYPNERNNSSSNKTGTITVTAGGLSQTISLVQYHKRAQGHTYYNRFYVVPGYTEPWDSSSPGSGTYNAASGESVTFRGVEEFYSNAAMTDRVLKYDFVSYNNFAVDNSTYASVSGSSVTFSNSTSSSQTVHVKAVAIGGTYNNPYTTPSWFDDFRDVITVTVGPGDVQYEYHVDVSGPSSVAYGETGTYTATLKRRIQGSSTQWSNADVISSSASDYTWSVSNTSVASISGGELTNNNTSGSSVDVTVTATHNTYSVSGSQSDITLAPYVPETPTLTGIRIVDESGNDVNQDNRMSITGFEYTSTGPKFYNGREFKVIADYSDGSHVDISGDSGLSVGFLNGTKYTSLAYRGGLFGEAGSWIIKAIGSGSWFYDNGTVTVSYGYKSAYGPYEQINYRVPVFEITATKETPVEVGAGETWIPIRIVIKEREKELITGEYVDDPNSSASKEVTVTYNDLSLSGSFYRLAYTTSGRTVSGTTTMDMLEPATYYTTYDVYTPSSGGLYSGSATGSITIQPLDCSVQSLNITISMDGSGNLSVSYGTLYDF